MIKLHQVVEGSKNDVLSRVSVLPNTSAIILNEMFVNHIDQVSCFDIGNVEGIIDMEAVIKYVRLPMPQCWFEFSYNLPSGKEREIGMLCYECPDASIQGIVYELRTNDHPTMVGAWHCSSNDDFSKTILMPKDVVMSDTILQFRNVVFVFLTILNCNNIKRVKVHPPIQLQKARKKRGRAPLYSYWTLHLDVTKEETMIKSTKTHTVSNRTSPRIHLRRGHIRHNTSGSISWVRSHNVGKRELGVVEKNYATNII